MKRIGCSVLILALLAVSLGCACGKVTGPEVVGPEHPDFFVLTDDAETVESLLDFFRANTGYVPTYVAFTEEAITKKMTEGETPLTREEAIQAIAETATIAVLKDAALAAELEACGVTALETPFEYTVLLKNEAGNNDAKKAIEKWLSGDEAAYLAEKPDLWN